MDHHCPWTGNCVSLQSFPYFLRFLVYTVLTLFYLLYLLSFRLSSIWASRSLPSYLGPSVPSLISITLLTLSNLTTIFLLSLLTFTTLKSALFNTTLIEDWEIERHESVLSRIDPYDSASSDFWSAEDAAADQLSRIEFPYDLGFFGNLSQAMGTSNPIRWVLPAFGGGPKLSADKTQRGLGWEYEENGFNDLPGLWPPPDPEKTRQAKRGGWPGAEARIREEEAAMIYDNNSIYGGQEDIKAAFARRQKEDMERRRRANILESQSRSGIIAELEEDEEEREGYEFVSKSEWKNSDGERLRDYGVDEEAEEETVGVDDDVPLAELIRRRKAVTRAAEE